MTFSPESHSDPFYQGDDGQELGYRMKTKEVQPVELNFPDLLSAEAERKADVDKFFLKCIQTLATFTLLTSN